MTKRKKIFAITAGLMALFLGWMLCSTHMIATLRNRGLQIEEYKSDEIYTGGFAFFEIGDVGQTSDPRWMNVGEDIYDTVKGAGYIYCITPETSEETSNIVILQSDKYTYELAPSKVYKTWMGAYYYELDPTPQSYSWFEFDVCPLNFKKGDYKIYIKAVYEDGTTVAIVDTGYHLIRQSGKTKIELRPSEQVERITEYGGWANSGLESISRDANGDIFINGWGILDGVNADDTNCIIEVFDENGYVGTYTTLPRTITYISDYFESDLYYDCGFMAKIPQFAGSELKVNVYVEYEETIYACGYGFESNGDFNEFVSYSRTDLF